MTGDDVTGSERGDGATCALARALLRDPDIEAVNLEGEHPTITRKGGDVQEICIAPAISDWICHMGHRRPSTSTSSSDGIRRLTALVLQHHQ